MINPYRIPDDGRWRTINVSGGRSSGYMLKHILDAHGGELPPRTVALFANTGKEHPKTLDFVRDMEEHWGVPIVWLEYRYCPERAGGTNDPRHDYAIVDHASATRYFEPNSPFDQSIRSRRALPSIGQRTCTSDMKVLTIRRYMYREHGLNKNQHLAILGYRLDEARRWQGVAQDCELQAATRYPMVVAEVTKPMILAWWRERNFNLGLPEDGRWSNCLYCFEKGKQVLMRNAREDPISIQWWIETECMRLENWSTTEKPDQIQARCEDLASAAESLEHERRAKHGE